MKIVCIILFGILVLIAGTFVIGKLFWMVSVVKKWIKENFDNDIICICLCLLIVGLIINILRIL